MISHFGEEFWVTGLIPHSLIRREGVGLILDEILNHKEIKDQILMCLYDNRGGRSPHGTHQIKKNIDNPLKEQQIRFYLLELVDEQLVRVLRGKSTRVTMPNVTFGSRKGKSHTETIPGTDTYYISEIGINYVENGFIKSNRSSNLDRLIQITEESKELLEQILGQAQISVEDQKVQNQMLMELKKALDEKDDSRARKILKESLDVGKQVAIPLLLEYIKGFAIGQ